MAEKKVIPFGIDFGTVNTCGAIWWNERVEVVANDLGSRTTPSYYYFDGVESFVGKTAKDKIWTNPKNVFYDAKRLLTRKMNDPLIKKFESEWNFELKEKDYDGSSAEYFVNETRKPLSPVSVVAGILKYIKECTEKRYQQEIFDVVITVPVYFSFNEINAIYEAAKLADLNVINFLTETTAAAIAYVLEQESFGRRHSNLFIVDLGAGGFNIAIVNIDGQNYKTLAASGSGEVGGRDFDHLIIDWVKQKLVEEGMDVKNMNQKEKIRMMCQAQVVKEALSTTSIETPVILSDFFETAKSRMFKRSEFEEMSKELMKKIENDCRFLLDEINFLPKDIDHIIFVGGSSRMRMVATMLEKIFVDKSKFSKALNPDEAVAIGATIYAAARMKASKRPEIIKLNIRDVVHFNEDIQICDRHWFIEMKFEYDFPSYFRIPLPAEYFDSKLFAVGIDLGTTECCAAVIRKSGPDFVQMDLLTSLPTMPSYIAFDESKPKCGQIVIDRMKNKAAYSVYDLKRIIGIPFEEIVIDSVWPFKVIKEDENVKIQISTSQGKQEMPVEQAYAVLLKHIKNAIEIYQDKDLIEAVITIPSNINENQLKATAQAAKLAGWQIVHFVPEPVAAAFAYSVEMGIPSNSNILICDCGGGTLDICIAKVIDNRLEILSHDGDAYLGGRDFDKLVYNHFDAILKHTYNINVTENNKKFALIQKCQDIKHTLSSEMEDWVDVNDYDMTRDDTIVIIKRQEFEEMAKGLLLRIKAVILRTITKSQIQQKDLNYILKVGGGCRMPMVRNLLSNLFPNANHRSNMQPHIAVAHGAALYDYHLKAAKNQ